MRVSSGYCKVFAFVIDYDKATCSDTVKEE
jgi:hypothetical protein